MMSLIKKSFIFLSLVFLVACTSDMSDLDRYIEETKKSNVGTVKPLPKFEPYKSYEYRSERNPFVPLEVLARKKKAAEELPARIKKNRVPEPLESFPLDALVMVGILEQNGSRWGLIRDSDGKVHRVSVGNFMGKDYGEIVKVTPQTIELVETVKDSSDVWVDRKSELRIGE